MGGGPTKASLLLPLSLVGGTPLFPLSFLLLLFSHDPSFCLLFPFAAAERRRKSALLRGTTNNAAVRREKGKEARVLMLAKEEEERLSLLAAVDD